VLLDADQIRGLRPEDVREAAPYPCFRLQQLLTPEGFQTLLDDFPSLDHFERHEGQPRIHGQRPHDRLYLAYDRSRYHAGATPKTGVIDDASLPDTWRGFIEELRDGPYRALVHRLLGVEESEIRFAWHAAFRGCEVSPHQDAEEKLGTHIFYFNTSDDWKPGWGGEFQILDDKRSERLDPDFADFASTRPVPFLDNQSLLFRNTPAAWHGVRPLECPDGALRRLFTVVFETPGAGAEQADRGRWGRLGRWLRSRSG